MYIVGYLFCEWMYENLYYASFKPCDELKIYAYGYQFELAPYAMVPLWRIRLATCLELAALVA